MTRVAASPFPERAMGRATASSRIDGNHIVLQFEGPVTFDAWLQAIARARRFVHFENYILRNDPLGRRFRDALVERARAGVQVRVLYDWVGCWATPRRYWRPFREAGVEVRAFNPPSVRDPFGLLQRDHRKLVVADGEVAFLGGFCVGQEWAGTPEEPPWRDTGVEIRGPAAAAAARTFERIWAEIGGVVPSEARSDPERAAPAGPSAAWLIEGVPWRSRVYRATQLMASVARERLWITDPYFLAPRPVAEGLMAAARDGVDVRVLVPAHNNWPWMGSLSRGGYRSLLGAGVRIFEWEGPMIHAKTSVVDGRWSRIGSSNLNVASLLGNWELDVGVLDTDLAAQVEGLFLADLASAVEIVLPARAAALASPPSSAPDVGKGGGHRGGVPEQAGAPGEAVAEGASPAGAGASVPEPSRLRATGSRVARGRPGRGIAPLDRGDAPLPERLRRWARPPGGQILSLADVVRAGTAFGDAIAGHRVVGREDRTALTTVAVLLLGAALVGLFFPRLVGWTVAVFAGWFGLVLAVRSAIQAWQARRDPVNESIFRPEAAEEPPEAP